MLLCVQSLIWASPHPNVNPCPFPSTAAEGGGDGAAASGGGDALQEMGKLNTARIRKAVDPKVLDVKKRVRAARRALKRESKVQLSDEIIFFDDVAGNEQVGWLAAWRVV